MQTPKHTPEPCAEIAELERLKRETPSCGPWIIQAETAEQNARIVACVNACAGLNPEAIPALVHLVRKVADQACDHGPQYFCPREEARAVLAALAAVRGSK